MIDIGALVSELIEAGTPAALAARVVAEAFAGGISMRSEGRELTKRQARNARYYDKQKCLKSSENVLNSLNQDDSDAVPPSPPHTPPYTPPHSEAIASASYPIDPQERLWAEGVDLLRDMGVPSNRAKPMVGKWLRDTRQDAVGVLAAIIRAREIGTRDPLPFIAGILKNLKGELHGKRDKAAIGGADRVIERVKGFIDDATPAVRPLLTLASG